MEIARRGPTHERDLDVIRGLSKRDLPAIVEVVRRGRDLPLEVCPPVAERDQDPVSVTMVTSILMAVLADLCAKRQLAANLVATTLDVKLLVRGTLAGDRAAAGFAADRRLAAPVYLGGLGGGASGPPRYPGNGYARRRAIELP